MAESKAIAVIHRDDIIARVAAGEYLASIAQSLGLKGKGQSISDYLADDPEYRAAREYGLEARMAQREGELEVAPKDDVPRARELLSHARWRAEREAPHRWGPKQEIKQDTTISIQVVRYAQSGPDAAQHGQVIEHVITQAIDK